MSLGKRYAILAGLAVVLVAGALVAYFSGDSRAREKPAAKGPAPAAVAVAAALQQSIPVRLQAIGNVEAYASVAVKSRVDGQILEVQFREGQEVKKGEILFRIDPRPFEAAPEAGRGAGRARYREPRPGGLAGEALPGAAGQEFRVQGSLRAVPHQRTDRRCDREGEPGGAGEREAESRVHGDPLADRRLCRPRAARRGQHGEGERHPIAGGDQPGEAGLRQLCDSGTEAGGRARTDAQGPAHGRRRGAGQRQAARRRPHRVPRQRSRPDHRNDQGARHLRQP